MGISVGELFIKLGFDVDDKKLKQFNDDVKASLDQLFKLGVAAGTAVTALNYFILSQTEGAVKLRNMTAELGTNSRAVQEWAAVVHQMNPAISIDEATDSYRRFSEVIKQQITFGNGPTGSLSILLGQYARPQMTEEEARQAIATNKQNVIKEFGGGAVGTAAFSKFLNEVGLGSGSTRVFDLNEQDYHGKARPFLPDEGAQQNLLNFADRFALFSEALDKFTKDFAGTLAPKLVESVNAATKALLDLAGFNNAHKEAVLPEAVAGGGFLSWLATKTPIGNSTLGRFLGGSLQAIGRLGGVGVLASAPWVGGEVGHGIGRSLSDQGYSWDPNHPLQFGKKSNKAESQAYWLSQGYSPDAVAGLMANEQAESGWDETSVGDNGHSFGSFQWQKKRAAAILKGTGIDVTSASHADQLKAAAWELKQMGIDKRLMSTVGAGNAGALVSRLFESPRDANGEAARRGAIAEQMAPEITQNITQNIHSSAPLDQTMDDVHKSNQRSLNDALTQIPANPVM